jgi:outer membrane protein assembly factor BamD (BamD/ComL family)
MRERRMRYVALAISIVVLCCHEGLAGGAEPSRSPSAAATSKSRRPRQGSAPRPQAPRAARAPDEQYDKALADIKEAVQAGDSKGAKAIAQQLKAEYPDRVGPDIDLYVAGELHYWAGHYSKALAKYEKLLKDYPGSEFANASQEREYEMATAYLQGRKKTILGFIKISGCAEGVEIMEKISDRAGLEEPNGVGLRATIFVAEYYERVEKYLDAYLKWSEVASVWETGPISKRAIFRMAEDNLAAYDIHPIKERYRFDASKLTTARTYYEKYLALYPEDAAQADVPAKIKSIDEQMAYKQFKIAQYYRHIGKHRAANLYLDMVIQNWPNTEAAGMAREAMAEQLDGEKARGK